MNKITIFQLIIIVLLSIILGVIIFAGQQTDTQNTNQDKTVATSTQEQFSNITFSTTADLGTKQITIGFPPWPGATVKSEVVASILRKVGYDVSTQQMDAGIVYTSLADKQIDITVAGWLPTTHESYWNTVGNELDVAGINVTQTWLGLGVPDHVDAQITSIEDLKTNTTFGEKVDYTITGIEPGAGIMENTETAIATYGLDNWTLQSSSASAMLTVLQEAFDDSSPIVTTVWQPHSSFAIGNIRKLDDPKGIYNNPKATRLFLEKHAPSYMETDIASDVIASVVYKGFAEDAPRAYNLLQHFSIPSETQSQWILDFSINEKNPSNIAQNYIIQNQDTIQNWLSQPSDDS